MAKVDIKIMAVKARRQNVLRMLETLGMQEADTVFYDDRPNGGSAMYTAQKTWKLPIPYGCTHRLVLQDDIRLCKDLKRYAKMCAQRYPESVFTFFHTSAKGNVIDPNNPYIKVRGKNKVCAQACMIPVKMIMDIWDWTNKNLGDDYPDDDLAMSHYMAFHKIDVYTTVPSLTENQGMDSMLNHTATKNSPLWFGQDLSYVDFKNGGINKSFSVDSGGVPYGMKKTEKSAQFFKRAGYLKDKP